MANIRITQFGGLMPEVHGKLIRETHAQVAHNCLLVDGKLRPQAEWVRVHTKRLDQWDEQDYELSYSEQQQRAIPYPMARKPVTLEGAPFATNLVVGAAQGQTLVRSAVGGGEMSEAFLPDIVATALSATVTYTRAYDSIKPINRLYAVSYVRVYDGRIEEGPLALLANQQPTDIVYEGDLVNIVMYSDYGGDGQYRVRLYRTITGLDTGTAATNELDTNWHLVSEMLIPNGGMLQYTDGASATALPMDMAYSMQFTPLAIEPYFFGLTESGWFVAASMDGRIQVSERFMHHAWPVENQLQIPAKIVDMVVSGDNVFFGTEGKPYMLAVSFGEKAMQAKIDAFGESMPCRPGTMAATPSGAMYASGQGLVSLGRDGMHVITRELANAGSVFATRTRREYDLGGTRTRKIECGIHKTGFGHYHAGKYYGFCFDRIVPIEAGSEQ